jgi:hypothetical protein
MKDAMQNGCENARVELESRNYPPILKLQGRLRGEGDVAMSELNQAAQALPTSGRTSNLSPPANDAHPPRSGHMGKDGAQLLRIRAQIQVLAVQASRFPEIRQEKVTALQRVILGGGYQPTADQLAQAVFVHMLVKPAA